MKKKYIGLVLFILVFILYRFIPAGESFGEPLVNATSFLALCMILWFTEFVPLGASAIMIIALAPIMGIMSLKEMLTSFPNPILFFVIATFALSTAITKLPIAKRMLLGLLKIMGGSVNKFILAVMAATFLLSSVMSNIPATAIFIPLCISSLEMYDNEEDRKKTGRAMMIGLAVAGMVGGIITPAGSSNNLIALSLLEEHAGVTISFINWMIICIPIACVILPLVWFLLVKVFKPVPIEREVIKRYTDSLSNMPKWSKKEIMAAVIAVTMIVLWILSSWITWLDTSIVAIFGMIAMFLPGIEIFTWKEFNKEVSWSVVLMTGSVLCVGSVLLKSGMTQWLGDTLLTVSAGESPFMLIMQLTALIAVMQLVIPNGPAVIAATSPLVYTAATVAGVNPAVLTIPLSILASWTIIIPLSAVPMITYSTGYYKIYDIGKVGIPVLLAVALIAAVWVPFMIGILM